MEIERYGVRLVQVSPKDLELVRAWRNAPHVREAMEYQEKISAAMQKAWFKRINKERNFYFIIQYQGDQVGVVNAKDIDWVNKQAETGIFIGQKQYLDSFIPVLAVLAMMDVLFLFFDLQSLQAKINRKRTKIVAFNEQLGYELGEEKKEAVFQYYQVTAARYFATAANWRKRARQLHGKDTTIRYNPDQSILFKQLWQQMSKEKLSALQLKEVTLL